MVCVCECVRVRVGVSSTPPTYCGRMVPRGGNWFPVKQLDQRSTMQNAPYGACLSKGWAVLQGATGGVLRNRHETYKAAEDMMASLGDQYSQFLPPSQVPSPAFGPSRGGCCRRGSRVLVTLNKTFTHCVVKCALACGKSWLSRVLSMSGVIPSGVPLCYTCYVIDYVHKLLLWLYKASGCKLYSNLCYNWHRCRLSSAPPLMQSHILFAVRCIKRTHLIPHILTV